MKVQIQEAIYEGTAVEIIDRLRTENAFMPNEFPDTDSYLRFLQDNLSRMAGMECPLPEGNLERRAKTMLGYLEEAGGLLNREDA